MNSRFEVILTCIFAWMILGLVGSSDGKAVDSMAPLVDPKGPTTNDGTMGTSENIVIPQVGFLEKTDDAMKTGEATNDADKGILVPIVSVVNADDSSAKVANPLVALLPASSAIQGSTDSAKLPVIETLPIIPAYDKAEPVGLQEIRRSLRDASSRTAANSLYNDDSTDEMMDVAEDIVFRPLFRIRPNANTAYSKMNLRRKNGPNYRRYNVNGYYRIPYDSFRYNNNRYDYGNDRRSSTDY